ncbi:MAG: ACP S-malonyltransferase [Verrucomicrobiota bacterium]
MGKRAVILFAGQGAQKVGMGKDLAESFPVAKELFDQAGEIAGFDLAEVMFEGPEDQLTRTSRCQPALYAHGLACLALLKESVPDLEIVGAAGLSLGEFTAHSAAGTFDFATGCELVAQRGRFMEEATDSTEGAMAAMIGGDDEAVAKLAEACDIDVANYNAPGQIVVSGSKDGVEQAVAGAKENGIRIAKKLDVAGAYHSRLMMPAQEKLAEVLANAEFAEPNVPVICNVDAAQVSSADEIRSTLERQVSGSVRWTESMQAFVADGVDTFIELGPGKVLAGLMKRTAKGVKVISIEDAASLQAAIEELS